MITLITVLGVKVMSQSDFSVKVKNQIKRTKLGGQKIRTSIDTRSTLTGFTGRYKVTQI